MASFPFVRIHTVSETRVLRTTGDRNLDLGFVASCHEITENASSTERASTECVFAVGYGTDRGTDH